MNIMSLIREIDDAPLNAYHRSMLLHLWRRRWAKKGMRELGESTGMSASKAGKTLGELVEMGWVTEGEWRGQIGWQIAPIHAPHTDDEPEPEEAIPEQSSVRDTHNSVRDTHNSVRDTHNSVRDTHTLYSSNTYGNTYGNAYGNADDARADPPPLPAHLRGFNAMWQEQKPPDLIRREALIKKVIRNPTDLENITAAAQLSMDLGVTDKQINDWFGPRGAYWYTVSHGRRDNLPPYAKNILSEVAGALQWSQLPPPPPPNGPPTVGIVGAVNEFGSY